MTTEPTSAAVVAAAAAAAEPIVQEARIDAPPERVFPFLVEADRMSRWFGKESTLEARPGGIYRVDTDGGSHVARGEFVIVEPPRRVVFTFGWENADEAIQPGGSTVEITLEPDDQGTLLRLEHRDLPNEAERTSHAEGWAWFLPRLAEAARAA
jgi:uncharacterized protein YndB with AHSA1/START domain